MVWLCSALIILAFLISWPTTKILIRVSTAAGAFDSAGVAGQIKEAPRRVPNTGGIAITLGVVIPIVLGLWFLDIDPSPNAEWRTDFSLVPADLHDHIAGIRQRASLAYLMIICIGVLHILGLVDDRKPLGPFFKLGVMAIPAIGVPLLTTLVPSLSETRLFTFLDARAGGSWLSIALTSVWFLVVINAMNFIDNMDGLSAGVAAVAASLFFISSLISGQWFIASVLALVIGSSLGFLVYNAPRPGGARIFMGDSGSIVLGFLLAFLTTRTTYFAPDAVGGGPSAPRVWYATLMPLTVLAVPLYDFVAVTLIRLSKGKSPFVGDLNHLSHRLVRRGLSKPASVGIIWGLTAITGISGVLLTRAQPWQAAIIGVQVAIILGVIAAFEYASAREPAA